MLMLFATSIHSRTPHGEEVLRRVRGFKRYLANDGEIGRSEVPATTERFLASAIALEESERWASQAFGGMPTPDWYTGSLFDGNDFASAVAGMDRHLVRGVRSATNREGSGIDDEGKVGGGLGQHGGAESGGGGGGGGAGEW